MALAPDELDETNGSHDSLNVEKRHSQPKECCKFKAALLRSARRLNLLGTSLPQLLAGTPEQHGKFHFFLLTQVTNSVSETN